MSRFMDTTDQHDPLPVDEVVSWGASLLFHLGLEEETDGFNVDRFVAEYEGRLEFEEDEDA